MDAGRDNLPATQKNHSNKFFNQKSGRPNSSKGGRLNLKKMYVYIQSEPGLFTVGFYAPTGKWIPESDHNEKEEAAKRVAFLNGQKQDF